VKKGPKVAGNFSAFYQGHLAKEPEKGWQRSTGRLLPFRRIVGTIVTSVKDSCPVLPLF
jgi:hypothetical protein